MRDTVDILGYIKRLFVKKDQYRFLIGNMDENIAKNILMDTDERGKFVYGKECGKIRGMGIPDYMAYMYNDFAERHELKERWTVDVSGILKDYGSAIYKIKEMSSKERPDVGSDAVYSYASRVFTDAVVLEEVCHAMGYSHDCDSNDAGVGDFFRELAHESHNVL